MLMFTKEQIMASKTLVNELRYLIVDLCDLRAVRVIEAIGINLNLKVDDFTFNLDDEH